MSQQQAKIHRRQVEVICGALVGLGVIAIVQMLSLNSLDIPLKISVCSFAVSIPSLTVVLLCEWTEIRIDFRSHAPWVSFAVGLLAWIGYISSLAGVSALFFHFMNYAGIIFLVMCVIGLSIWVVFEGAAAEDLDNE
jgi:hypothetical protein